MLPSQCSYLHLPSAGITDVNHCSWHFYGVFVSMITTVMLPLSFWHYLSVSLISFFLINMQVLILFIYIFKKNPNFSFIIFFLLFSVLHFPSFLHSFLSLGLIRAMQAPAFNLHPQGFSSSPYCFISYVNFRFSVFLLFPALWNIVTFFIWYF